MAIRRFYRIRKTPGWKWDKRKKQWFSWGYDIWLDGHDSKRVRDHGFPTQVDAEAAVARLRLAQKETEYGFLPRAAVPALASLIERHLARISNNREHTRSKRVLHGWLALLPPAIKITDVDTPAIDLYVDKRLKDGVGPASVDRELNIISATLNAVDIHYSAESYKQLRQWRPPRIPRPVYSKKKRNRVVTIAEREKLVRYLLAPQKEGECLLPALARQRAGKRVQFAFFEGCRHSEIVKMKKVHVDWRRRTATIKNAKGDKDRRIDPLTDTGFAILEEMAAQSGTEYIWGSQHISSRFYRILKEACEACDIPYGRGVADGMVLHDARHSVTTEMLQESIDPATVQEQMGWSQREFLLHYSHSTADSRARGAEARERRGRTSGPEGDKSTPEEIQGLH